MKKGEFQIMEKIRLFRSREQLVSDQIPFLLESRMYQRSLFYFSRSERIKRALLGLSLDQQPLITSFFPVLNEVDCLKKEIENLKSQLKHSMNFGSTEKEERSFGGLLQYLVDCAIENQNKKPQGRRYGIQRLRKLCGGAQLNELFAANLIIPSLSLTKSILLSSNVMKEGKFRFDALKEHLQSRNAPLEVFISEYATRITGRIQYHPSTNQIVGFVLSLNSHGIPIVGSYPATCAKEMGRYFKECETSNNAYVIMAQPISSDAPPFCLAIFGTNSKFGACHVVKRWSWMTSEAEKRGIRIAGYASDGDSKLLSAMRFKTVVPSPKSPWKWFHSDLVSPQVYFQDFVHLLVKLKTRLLKPSFILPMGPEFLANKGHLVELIDTISPVNLCFNPR
ncbi:Protein translocase subunit 2 [Frankliniella fusca]|uniref:Protein translocase subunit 2 n=1 Tax=Frankliniella fusca TaxID=407009 RepID=A0AAE1GVI2_9NEOP|nr:Protein translocase subunit 2 [Frankliniella fusca]